MAIIQEVKDGKIVEDASSASSSSKKKSVDNNMGKDQFLQLLVAQMQYQDPLEPTSNTEWVAQMATFTAVEALNNMQDTMDEQSAYDLVGKYVLLNVGSGDDSSYVKGKVDYITVQNGKLMLSVNDKLYSIDTLDTVADDEYFEGSVQANTLHQMIALLPNVDNLSVLDEGLVKSAREAYDALTDAQKEFVEKEDLDKLRELETRMDSLKATQYDFLVRTLPSVEEIEAADEETLANYGSQLAEVVDYYDGLTDAQKENVVDGTVDRMHVIEDAIEQAAAKFDHSSDGDDTSDTTDVSAILKQILEEIQKRS